MYVVQPTPQCRIMDSAFKDTWKVDFPKSIMMVHKIPLLEICVLCLVVFEKASTFYKFYKLSLIPMYELDCQITSQECGSFKWSC